MIYGLDSWNLIISRDKRFMSISQHKEQLWDLPSNFMYPIYCLVYLFCAVRMQRLPIYGIFLMASDYYEMHQYRNKPTEITEQDNKLLPYSPAIHVEPTDLFSTMKQVNLCERLKVVSVVNPLLTFVLALIPLFFNRLFMSWDLVWMTPSV
jgi:hypothetical protein